MNKIRRVITLFIIIMVYPYAMLYGQAETTEVDSTFEQQMSGRGKMFGNQSFLTVCKITIQKGFSTIIWNIRIRKPGKVLWGKRF